MNSEIQSLETTLGTRFYRALVVAMLAGAIATGVLYLFDKAKFQNTLSRISPFLIQEVNISAEWPLSVSEIKTWLPTIEGKNLLTFEPTPLIQNLQRHAWVENVLVKKEYPNRLLIRIECRRPQALTLVRGLVFFIDQNGKVIERVKPTILKALDLPFLSVTMDSTKWNIPAVIAMVDKFKEKMGPHVAISQLVLGSYPYFKIFLKSPKVEVLLNLENWETQITVLNHLLTSSPTQIGQLQRINLIFPKKAVVTAHN